VVSVDLVVPVGRADRVDLVVPVGRADQADPVAAADLVVLVETRWSGWSPTTPFRKT
jgi:hypothetical protein